MPLYIDADALIENIKRVYCTDCNNYNEVRCRACGTADAMAMIEDAPTADVAPRAEWISVDERFPEVDGRQYLVWDDVQATVKTRFFYRIPPNIPLETYPHIREYFGNVSDYKRFTHWMPLPEPPVMKGE